MMNDKEDHDDNDDDNDDNSDARSHLWAHWFWVTLLHSAHVRVRVAADFLLSKL